MSQQVVAVNCSYCGRLIEASNMGATVTCRCGAKVSVPMQELEPLDTPTELEVNGTWTPQGPTIHDPIDGLPPDVPSSSPRRKPRKRDMNVHISPFLILPLLVIAPLLIIGFGCMMFDVISRDREDVSGKRAADEREAGQAKIYNHGHAIGFVHGTEDKNLGRYPHSRNFDLDQETVRFGYALKKSDAESFRNGYNTGYLDGYSHRH